MQALTDLFEVRWPALPGPGAASPGPARPLPLLPAAKPGSSLLLGPPGPPARPPTQLASDGRLHVHAAQQQQMAAAVGRAAAVLAEGRYLHLPYTTLFEYLAVGVAGVGVWVGGGGGGGEGVRVGLQRTLRLRCRSLPLHTGCCPLLPRCARITRHSPAHPQYLRAIAAALQPAGAAALFYLAAAVSDFYMPWADMVGLVGARRGAELGGPGLVVKDRGSGTCW